MSILLTQSAAQQITHQLEKRGRGLGLRLGVKKSGCSGFAYVLDYVDTLEEVDQIFE
jgi:iron-sulfur cluster assembly protein